MHAARAILLGALLLAWASPCPGQAGDADDPGGTEQRVPVEGLEVPEAVPLSPADALGRFQVEAGFAVSLAAAEPQVVAPVALSFDEWGRIFVVEMRGYMNDPDGAGEDEASGRIVLLRDTDGDGHFEDSRVFLDGLVLPRAVARVAGGILVAEPPRLWFVPERDGRAGERILVDAQYAVGGNPEHQPNGLVRALDNWIYSAKSAHRYRYRDGRWEKGATEPRGQWGLVQDDDGRLFYNVNFQPLRGDFLPPSTTTRHPGLEPEHGVDQRIVEDLRVWPARVTTGVNRAYREGVLDEGGRLATFTAASGPTLYRGALFPEPFRGNAFVPEPAAHLIHRSVLEARGVRVVGRHAHPGREFLTSTDERFRPVNLYTGPEGALWVVDLHRGIIQHKTYMTSHLRREIESRGLARPLDRGRIYRVAPEGAIFGPLPRPGALGTAALVAELSHPNGWRRDTAQRLLVERGGEAAVPALRALVADAGAADAGRIHALWTLAGLGALEPGSVGAALAARSPRVVAHGARVAHELASGPHAVATLALLEARIEHPSERVQLALAVAIGSFEGDRALAALAALAARHGGDDVFREAIASGLAGREEAFLAKLREDFWHDRELAKRVGQLARAPARPTQAPPLDPSLAEGERLYQEVCMACHNVDGRGVPGVAPPLVGSEWVRGDPGRLARIALRGLRGPVTVAGREYAPPDVAAEMPGFADSPALDDSALAGLLSYVRARFGDGAAPLSPEQVARARRESASDPAPPRAADLGD